MTIAACDRGATAETPGAKRVTPSFGDDSSERVDPGNGEDGFFIGIHRLSADPVVDGDTIRVEGLEGGVRLLFIDTEELFRGHERRPAAKDFDAYLKRARGSSPRPVKPGTPMGEEAARFASEFFDGADVVRLERDHVDEARGQFGRLLAYALVQKNGRWVSYNEACIRAGMSPYFTKYGYSRRFDAVFTKAEAEARRAKRGIWNPSSKSYRDYDERKAWWNARARFIRAFEDEAQGRDDFVILSRESSEGALEARLGREVTALSTVAKIRRFERLVNVSLAMRPKSPLPLIFFDRAVFEESGLSTYLYEPVRARGTIERYEKGSYRTLQIVVKDPRQVTLPELPPTD